MKHERVSIFSVSAKETVRLLTIFIVITVGYAVFVIGYTLRDEQSFSSKSVLFIISHVSRAVPVAIVLTLIVDLGGYYMSLLRNWRNREIIAETEARVNKAWTEWNNRRVDAETKGETFSEPPPNSVHAVGNSTKTESTHVNTSGK